MKLVKAFSSTLKATLKRTNKAVLSVLNAVRIDEK